MDRREMLTSLVAASPMLGSILDKEPVEVTGKAKMLIFSLSPMLLEAWSEGSLMIDVKGMRQSIDDAMKDAGISVPYVILVGMEVKVVE